MTDLVLLAVAFPFLIFSAWTDLRFLRLWNRANLAFALAFLVVAPFLMPFGDIAARVAAALCVGAVLIVLSIFGQFGGGDAKFFGALMLWIAPQDYAPFCVIVAACGLMMPPFFAAAKASPWLRAQTPTWRCWKTRRTTWRKKKLPMGVSFASAGVLYLILRAVNAPVLPG
ncbi:MAG: prepilin peptidase [Pseudomonadota bacterium]